MAPLEPWEKVLVSADFLKSSHGKFTCIDCHGGVQAESKDKAHAGLVSDPSKSQKAACATCHANQAAGFEQSLHVTLNGYQTVLAARSTPAQKPALDKMFGNHCSNCHVSCGDCHISQPKSVGAGFLNGHVMEKTPPMTRTCTACHGSRVGNEYLGHNEEIPGDVHFRQGRMNCVTCHTGADMHTTPTESNSHRYAGAQLPKCETCHAKVGASGDTVVQHTVHQGKLSCQVCHSVVYSNCEGCHTSISKETNNAIYKVDKTYLGFFIGKNALKSADRPYEYVTVRHIPAAADNFAFYGENLLPNFNKLPTWAYATPHNIQRKTAQNESCTTCHSKPDLFLTADKVAKNELEANKPVIVDKLPKALP